MGVKRACCHTKIGTTELSASFMKFLFFQNLGSKVLEPFYSHTPRTTLFSFAVHIFDLNHIH
ncbi:hypothetical protein AOA59_00425 [Pseudomonas sp. 2822-15]|nr:hypothetical protein AOA59_00425 [Pseudomonas sp. 2822-15]